MSDHCVNGTTRINARCVNASTIVFVPKENPDGTHSSLKILMTIVNRTFSRPEAKRLLIPRVEKSEVKSVLTTSLLHYFISFCKLSVESFLGILLLT